MSLSQNYPTTRPTLTLDFAKAKRVDPRVTFTRASTATYFDASGTLRSAADNVPRIDFNPSTLLCQGLLIEESRTNSIRNNTMVGAVAGTPGTLPTNWFSIAGGLGTLTQQIVGTGTSAGITYIDIRLSGTTSTTSVGYTFESINHIAASVGQTWTGSFYVAQVAGTNTNISSIQTRVIDRDVGGGNIGASINDFISSLATSFTRPTITRTLAAVGTAFVSLDIFISFASGVAIDITLRIGLPQLELGAFATSVIPTTTTALTRSADVASVNTLSPWYNATEGTIYTEFSAYNTSTSRVLAQLDDTGFNNRIFAFVQANNGIQTNVVVGGSSVAQLFPAGTYTSPAIGKISQSYAVNNFASCFNGGAVSTDTSGAIPTVTQMRIGFDGGSAYSNGHLRRIAYYNTRLPNAQLQALTAP